MRAIALAGAVALVSTGGMAAGFDKFFKNVEGHEARRDAALSADVREKLFARDNPTRSYIAVVRLMRENREAVTRRIREMDERIAGYIAEAKAAAEEDRKRAEEARFVSMAVQMVSLVNAVSNLAYALEDHPTTQRGAELEELFGDDWQEDAFDAFFLNSDDALWEENAMPQRLPAGILADGPPEMPAGAPTVETKLNYLEDTLSWLDENGAESGDLTEAGLARNRGVIADAYRVLFSLSPTEADLFEEEYKLTIGSVTRDFIGDWVTDEVVDVATDKAGDLLKDAFGWDLPTNRGIPMPKVLDALKFYLEPQVVGDGEIGGRGWRMWVSDRLNGYAEQYVDRSLGFRPHDYETLLKEFGAEVRETEVCATGGCIRMPH